MILARSTPHALGRFAGLVVLAVAVCLLPMLPSLGEAQAPVPARGEGDLDRIKEELARKMREIEDLKRRAEEIAREQQRLAEARARKDAEKRRVEVKDKVARIEGGSGTTFRLEISGMGNSKEDIEKLTRAIQVALPDNAKVIIVASGQGMGGTSKGPAAGGQSKGDKWHFEWRHDDPKSKSSEPKPAMTPRSGDGMPGMGGSAGAPGMPPGMGGMGGFGGGMGPDRRIETLEKKLDDIMKQLEALRKEMRRPGGGGGGGRGGVPSSSEIPIPPTVAAPRTPATPVAPVAPVAPVPPTPVVPAAPAAPAPGGPTPQ